MGQTDYIIRFKGDYSALEKDLNKIGQATRKLEEDEVLIKLNYDGNIKEFNKVFDKISNMHPELGIQFQYNVNEKMLKQELDKIDQLTEIKLDVDENKVQTKIKNLADNVDTALQEGMSKDEITKRLKNVFAYYNTAVKAGAKNINFDSITNRLYDSFSVEADEIKNIFDDVFDLNDNRKFELFKLDKSVLDELSEAKSRAEDIRNVLKSLEEKGASKTGLPSELQKVQDEIKILRSDIEEMKGDLKNLSGDAFDELTQQIKDTNEQLDYALQAVNQLKSALSSNGIKEDKSIGGVIKQWKNENETKTSERYTAFNSQTKQTSGAHLAANAEGVGMKLIRTAIDEMGDDADGVIHSHPMKFAAFSDDDIERYFSLFEDSQGKIFSQVVTSTEQAMSLDMSKLNTSKKSEILQQIKDEYSKIDDSLVGNFSGKTEELKSAVNNILDSSESEYPELISKIRSNIDSMFESIGESFSWMDFSDSFDDLLISSAKDVAKTYSNPKEMISKLLPDLGSIMENVENAVLNPLTDLAQQSYQEVLQRVFTNPEFLKSGETSAIKLEALSDFIDWGSIEDSAREAAQKAADALQEAQDSNSPAELTKPLGKDFGLGYAEGIREAMPEITAACKEIVLAAYNAMDEAKDSEDGENNGITDKFISSFKNSLEKSKSSIQESLKEIFSKIDIGDENESMFAGIGQEIIDSIVVGLRNEHSAENFSETLETIINDAFKNVVLNSAIRELIDKIQRAMDYYTETTPLQISHFDVATDSIVVDIQNALDTKTFNVNLGGTIQDLSTALNTSADNVRLSFIDAIAWMRDANEFQKHNNEETRERTLFYNTKTGEVSNPTVVGDTHSVKGKVSKELLINEKNKGKIFDTDLHWHQDFSNAAPSPQDLLYDFVNAYEEGIDKFVVAAQEELTEIDFTKIANSREDLVSKIRNYFKQEADTLDISNFIMSQLDDAEDAFNKGVAQLTLEDIDVSDDEDILRTYGVYLKALLDSEWTNLKKEFKTAAQENKRNNFDGTYDFDSLKDIKSKIVKDIKLLDTSVVDDSLIYSDLDSVFGDNSELYGISASFVRDYLNRLSNGIARGIQLTSFETIEDVKDLVADVFEDTEILGLSDYEELSKLPDEYKTFKEILTKHVTNFIDNSFAYASSNLSSVESNEAYQEAGKQALKNISEKTFLNGAVKTYSHDEFAEKYGYVAQNTRQQQIDSQSQLQSSINESGEYLAKVYGDLVEDFKSRLQNAIDETGLYDINIEGLLCDSFYDDLQNDIDGQGKYVIEVKGRLIDTFKEVLQEAIDSLGAFPIEVKPYMRKGSEIEEVELPSVNQNNLLLGDTADSDIGLTYDQLIEKIRLENEEVQKGNIAFKERITLLKNNKVVDSLLGDTSEINTGVFSSNDFDKVIHTHEASTLSGGILSSEDYINMLQSNIKNIDLIWRDTISNFDFSQLNDDEFEELLSTLLEVNNAAKVLYSMNFFEDEEETVNYIKQAISDLTSQSGGNITWADSFLGSDDKVSKLLEVSKRFQDMRNEFNYDKGYTYDDYLNENEIISSKLKKELSNQTLDSTSSTNAETKDLLSKKEVIEQLRTELNLTKKAAEDLFDAQGYEKTNNRYQIEQTAVEELIASIKEKQEIEGTSENSNNSPVLASIDAETQKFDELKKKIATEIPNAIQKKNDAFRKEEEVVAEVVGNEIDYFDVLKDSIGDVETAVQHQYDTSMNATAKDKESKTSTSISSQKNLKSELSSLDKIENKIKELGLSANATQEALSLLYGGKATFLWIGQNQEEQWDKINDLIQLYKELGIVKREVDDSDAFTTTIETTSLKDIQKQKYQSVGQKSDILKEMAAYYSQLEEESAAMAEAAFSNAEKKVNSLLSKISKLQSSGKYTQAFTSELDAAEQELRSFSDDLKNGNIPFDELESKITSLADNVENTLAKKAFGEVKLAAEKSLTSVGLKIDQIVAKNSAMGDEFESRFQKLRDSLDTAESIDDVQKLVAEVNKLESELIAAGKTGRSFFDQIKQRLRDINSKYIAQYFSFQDIIRYARTAISTIQDLNTQMVELAKVSEQSLSEIQDDFNSYADTAKDLGSTITDTISATADWARMGYNVPDSQELARVALLYKNVGDGIDVSAANESLISTLQGYQMTADEAEHIVDVFNEVANNFAIDTGGIGEALQRSAASLNAANTSLEQSVALVTAANTVVQNPESVGTTFKTLSARIRGATTELEDLGEEEDEFTQTTSKLQGLVKQLTGFDILEDDQKTFKSIYDIIIGIGKEWKNLDDIEQASLGEALAGKRNANTLYAILDNIETLESAYATAEDSAGSAMREQQNFEQGLEYSINRAKAALEELANDAIDSELVKSIVDAGTTGIEFLDKIIDKVGVLGTSLIGISTFLASKKIGLLNIFRGDLGELQTNINALSQYGKEIRTISTASKAIGNISDSFDVSSIEAYRNILAGLTTEQKALVLSTSSLSAEQANLVLTSTEGSLAETALTEAEANRVLTEAGLLTTTQALSAVELTSLSTKTGLTEVQLSSALAEAGAIITKEGDILVTEELNQAELQQALVSRGVEEANAAETASYISETVAKKSASAATISYAGTTDLLVGVLNKLKTVIAAHPILTFAAILGAGVYAIKKYKDSIDDLIESANEIVTSYDSTSESLRKNNSEFNSLVDRYVELSDGVNSLGKNVSLTSGEYEEYLGIVNSISDMVPTLIKGYDEQGNAILTVKDNVEALTKAYNENIIAANNSLLADSKKVIDATQKSQVKFNAKDSSQYQTEAIENLLNGSGTIDDLLSKYQDVYSGGFYGYEYKDLTKLLDDLGIDPGFTKDDEFYTTEEEAKEFTEKLRYTLDHLTSEQRNILQGYVDRRNNEFEDIFKGERDILKANIENAILTDDELSKLPDSIKTALLNISDSIDVGEFLKFDNPEEISAYATQITDAFKGLSDEELEDIEEYINISTLWNNNELSYNEYITKLQALDNLLQELFPKNEEVQKSFKILFDIPEIDDVENKVDNLINRRKNIISNDEATTSTNQTNSLGGATPLVQDFLSDESQNENNGFPIKAHVEIQEPTDEDIQKSQEAFEKWLNSADLDKAKISLLENLDEEEWELTTEFTEPENYEEWYNDLQTKLTDNPLEVKLTVDQGIDKLDELEDKIDSIDDLWNNTVNKIDSSGNATDGVPSASDIADVNDSFGGVRDDNGNYTNMAGALMKFDEEITQNIGNTEKQKDAYNDLITSSIVLDNTLQELTDDVDNVTEAQKEEYIQMLENKDITNARDVVESRLSKRYVASRKNIINLNNAINENRDALEQGESAGVAYENAISNIQDEVNNLFGTYDEDGNFTPANFDTSFIKENLEDITEAADGSQQAINNVYAAAAKDHAEQILIDADLNTEDFDTAKSYLDEVIDKASQEDITVDALLNDSSFMSALTTMLSSSKTTADAINAALADIGVEIKYNTTAKKIRVLKSGGTSTSIPTSAAAAGANGGSDVVHWTTDEVTVDDISITATKKGATSGTKANYSPSSSSSSSNGGSDGGDSGGSDDTNTDEETFDWVEVAINSLEQELDRLDEAIDDVYDNWETRNQGVTDKISKLTNEIELQKQAAARYEAEAEKYNDIGEEYIQKIKEGTLDIETLEVETSDDDDSDTLIEKIQNYQTWWEKAQEAHDQVGTLTRELGELYKQVFDNIESEYDDMLDAIAKKTEIIEERISRTEEHGFFVDEAYYTALKTLEESNYKDLEEERKNLITALNTAVTTGNIEKGSEAWYEMYLAIQDVNKAIEESMTNTVKLNNEIRQLSWDKFDWIEERMDDFAEEADFLIKLLQGEETIDDRGYFNDRGYANAALVGAKYDDALAEAQRYKAEITEIDKQLATEEGKYDKNLIDRKEELVGAYRDAIEAAEDEKQAMKSLVEEAMKKHLDYLSKLIDKYKDALSTMKSTYEYAKNINDQTKNISNLEKQLAAYQGDTSEEARKKRQELQNQLDSAQQQLEETQWDKYISETGEMLDNLYDNYETYLNDKLSNVTELMSSMIDMINQGTYTVPGAVTLGMNSIIAQLSGEGSITTAVKDTTISIQTGMDEIRNEYDLTTQKFEDFGNTANGTKDILSAWSNGKYTNESTFVSKLDEVKNKFSEVTNGAADTIKNAILSKSKDITVNDNGTVGATDTYKKDNGGASNGGGGGTTTTGKDNPSGNTDNSDDFGYIERVRGTWEKWNDQWFYKNPDGTYMHDTWFQDPDDGYWYYFDPFGVMKTDEFVEGYWIGADGKMLPDYFSWQQTNGQWWYGTEDGSKYATGTVYINGTPYTFDESGWWKGYAKGTPKIPSNQLAWTQEEGSELIYRTTDGALLTPLGKGDMVFTNAMSQRLWDIASGSMPFGFNLDSPNVSANANQNVTANNSITIELPNVQNYDDFKREMKQDTELEKFWQEITIGQMMGNARLKKNKY